MRSFFRSDKNKSSKQSNISGHYQKLAGGDIQNIEFR